MTGLEVFYLIGAVVLLAIVLLVLPTLISRRKK